MQKLLKKKSKTETIENNNKKNIHNFTVGM